VVVGAITATIVVSGILAPRVAGADGWRTLPAPGGAPGAIRPGPVDHNAAWAVADPGAPTDRRQARAPGRGAAPPPVVYSAV